jgi:hypothetical protein
MTPRPTRRPYPRYMRWLGAMLAVYFVITAILSLTINPWRINSTPLSLASMDPWREIGENVRVGKAALANRGDWETIIIGSSRMEIGFDPTNDAFGDATTVNLAMAAAGITETAPVAQYILNRNPGTKTLIYGIDGGDLYSDFDSRKFTRFHQSPFADNNISIERGINQLIGGRSLVDSIGTIQRSISKKQPGRTQLGRWLEPTNPTNIRRYIESNFNMGFEKSADKWSMREQQLRTHKSDLVFDVLGRARKSGIAVHVIIPAQHALKQMHPTEDEPEVMCWQADIKTLIDICSRVNEIPSDAPPVKLWSFLIFNKYTTESLPVPEDESQRLDYWFDLGHAKPDLVSAALPTILGQEPGDQSTGEPLCVNLLEGSWDDHLRTWIAGHRAYCKAHREDVKWWRDLMSQQGIK